ncbi:hypothetical protein B0H65DRAFT_454798 [Neurospora tetraspora]|uniref:Uncharacterized protein n=1 Tax=Neurospora tetraspora TaxID=94610 RepID=A0AAE0MTJ0_9PEZI|nr:hypothetical protein B0H65DRAFT_454798 [Neurospora tetraspora]
MEDTTEPPSEHTSTPQTPPMDPQPFGPREPQPYRVIWQSPAPSPTPTPPPLNDYPLLNSSRYLEFEEELRMRTGRFREREGSLNDPPSQHEHDYGYRNRAATHTGPDTSEDRSDDAQNQPQYPHDGTPSSEREPQWLKRISRPARVAIRLVSGSAVIGGLGWKLWHSRVGGELFTEAVASSEALMVVGRGLMGVSAAVARGVWAVARHAWRHSRPYTAFGLVYGLWSKGELLGNWVILIMYMLLAGPSREPCYCYACRVEMALAIRRETGMSLAEILAPDEDG